MTTFQVDNPERGLVGTLADCVISNRRQKVAEIGSWLKPEHFSDYLWRGMYRALLSLSMREGPATTSEIVRTIMEAPERTGTIDTVEIGRCLVDYRGLHFNLRYFAHVVYEQWRRKNLAGTASDVASSLENGANPDQALLTLGAAQTRYAPPPELTAKSNMDVFQELVTEYTEGPSAEAMGLSTGLADLDEMIGGLRPCTITHVAARTSGGKSALCGHIAANTAIEHGQPVIYYSAEMPNRNLIERWVAWVDHDDNIQSLAAVRSSPIEIRAGSRNIAQIEAEVRSYASNDSVALVVVDYIQQIRTDRKTSVREQEVADVSRRLKLLAMDTGVPFLVAVQLNRQSAGDTPKLHHMRESGSIEQDGDVCILLDSEESRKPCVDMTLVVAKNRAGERGTVKCVWDRPRYRFESRRFSEFDSYNRGG